MHTKFSAAVMVLGIVSSEGDVKRSHLFDEGIRINANGTFGDDALYE